MTKIPVGETILYAYRFAFGHIGAILGLIWLPMVLVTVAGFFATQRYYADMADALTQNNYASMGPAMLMMLGYFVLALLLYAMMYVSVTQLALDMRKPGALVHFAFGKTEWRMFRAILAVIGLLFFPVALAVGAAGFASAILGPTLGRGAASLGIGAAVLVFDLAILFVLLRFAFLIPPVAVAEEGRPLERAWTLSAKNFWRILAVLLAAVGPMVILTVAAQLLMIGTGRVMPDFSPTAAGTAAQMRRMSADMPLVMGIGFLFSPLTLGLLLGAASYAYRRLKDPQNGAAVTLRP